MVRAVPRANVLICIPCLNQAGTVLHVINRVIVLLGVPVSHQSIKDFHPGKLRAFRNRRRQILVLVTPRRFGNVVVIFRGKRNIVKAELTIRQFSQSPTHFTFELLMLWVAGSKSIQFAIRYVVDLSCLKSHCPEQPIVGYY